jgi:hypothetical protein
VRGDPGLRGPQCRPTDLISCFPNYRDSIQWPTKPSSPGRTQIEMNQLEWCLLHYSPDPVMNTSRVSSPRYSASRVFFCIETASLYSSPTRLHSPTPPTHFPLCHRFLRHSMTLASTREGAALPTTLDSPRARLAHSCASLTRPPSLTNQFKITARTAYTDRQNGNLYGWLNEFIVVRSNQVHCANWFAPVFALLKPGETR